MKKCVNWTVQMNIDPDERLQKERVEGRILSEKCCVRNYLSQVYEACFYLNIFLLALLSFGFTGPAILLLDFQTLHPVKSNISSMKHSPSSWQVSQIWCASYGWSTGFIFLLNCFSFRKCSFTFPLSSVELAAIYTRFIKWCLRATPIRRSRLHQVRWNAERLVWLITDVKALISSCSLQYVS